jgi:hypothetical protein
VAADLSLAEIRDEASLRATDPPALDEVIEDAGRQRLAAYYVYSALLAGLIGTDDMQIARWPAKLAEPMQRMGLARFAPRTGRGLDALLTPAEQATWRRPDKQSEFAHLLVDLINKGAFGPLCGSADSVRLATSGERRGMDLELIEGQRVVGICKVEDHWELVAQHLAGAPLLDSEAQAESVQALESKLARQLKETGISHAVSLTTDLAVSIHPLGAAVGLGTRLVRSRIQTGRDQADSLRHLGEDLRALRAQADGELNEQQAGRSK